MTLSPDGKWLWSPETQSWVPAPPSAASAPADAPGHPATPTQDAAKVGSLRKGGIALIAGLVAVALLAPIFLRDDQGTVHEATVTSDAQQVGVGLEAYFTDTQVYPSALDSDFIESIGVSLSQGVSIRDYDVDDDSSTFSYCAVHESGAWAVYKSSKNAIAASGPRDTECG
jgi:hypothetical protein